MQNFKKIDEKVEKIEKSAIQAPPTLKLNSVLTV